MELPEPVRLANLLRIIIEEPEIAEDISEQFISQDMAAAYWRPMGQSLSKIRTASELDVWCGKWKERLHNEVDFPDPPVDGGKPLRPLASAQDMRREAREMRNCLDELINSVLGGRAYFYHWGGPQRATVMLETCSESEWYVSRVLGPGNAVIGERLVRRITRIMNQQLGVTSPGTQISNRAPQEALISCKPNKNWPATRREVRVARAMSAGSSYPS